ncbi:MAG: ribosome silencing factor [Coriobacteriia bacterium]|nr:ribosome silencing factor [Actinomycetota bacterium]MDZ4167021.1 ribosome silencing factor [Coriobacteriia bacterium]
MTKGVRALEPRDIAVLAASAAAEKKAEDIVVLDVAATLVITSYFVVATGRSDRQVRTIADEVEDAVRVGAGVKPIGREGQREGRWVLLDFGEVVVHVFQPDEREFYRLEKLWSDSPRVALPESVTGATAAGEHAG